MSRIRTTLASAVTLACGLCSPAMASVTRAQIAEQFGRLPIRFEANGGQADPRVRFVTRGAGYALFFTGNEAVMALPALTLRWELVGANASAEVVGEEPMTSRSHYLTGNDPDRWISGVAHYAQVRYRQVYPGIDLVYHGTQRDLEYDFVVAPGADPGLLRMRYTGHRTLGLNERGDLLIRTDAGELVHRRPVVYQDVDGERRPVEGRFMLNANGMATDVAFAVSEYDRTRPLVIDPVLSYSTFLAGDYFDHGRSIAVDGAGNVYVTGLTYSGDFPLAGALQPTHHGGNADVFVSKLDASGSALVYSTYLGGSGFDQGNAIAVDGTGNAYVTGFTGSINFPLSSAIQPAKAAVNDAFVAKLNPTGGALVYSTYLGGDGYDQGRAIAVDAAGSAFVTGDTKSTDFPRANALQATYGGANGGDSDGGGVGGGDAFVTRISASGSALTYSTYLGGTADERGLGIAVDAAGRAYVTGDTWSTDFPQAAAMQSANGGFADAFVSVLNPTGSALTWSTYFGGNGHDYGFGIAVDGARRVYVTGETRSSNFPLQNALQTTTDTPGRRDVFVSKFNAGGASLAWSTYLGGLLGHDSGYGIAVDGAGNVFVTGQTASPDFPQVDTLQPAKGGVASTYDAFVAKLTANGSALAYSTFLGGGKDDRGFGIAVDGAGGAYVIGDTESADFPLAAALDPTFGGRSDAFISRIDAPPAVSFSVANASAPEGATRKIEIVLSAPSSKAITVPFTLSGKALAGDDYTLTPAASLRFPAGETSRKLTIVAIDDEAVENNENAILTLGTPTNATLGSAIVHTFRIRDND